MTNQHLPSAGNADVTEIELLSDVTSLPDTSGSSLITPMLRRSERVRNAPQRYGDWGRITCVIGYKNTFNVNKGGRYKIIKCTYIAMHSFNHCLRYVCYYNHAFVLLDMAG